MKRILLFALILSLTTMSALAGNGNGLPPGPRFMLNVIAFDQCPSGEFTDSNRHMIAVQANYSLDQNGSQKNLMVKTNTIALSSSGVDGDFQVMDGNACADRGRDGAEFVLPITAANCDADCPVEDPTFTQYRVYVRLVGRPNTEIGVTTCASELDGEDYDGDLNTDEILCSTESVVKVRDTGKGKMRFTDETAALLTICLDTFDDLNFDGNCDVRLGIFDPALEDYFWQWNTKGKAHAQLVFIPVT